jgi:hypothetical protein
MKSLMKKLHLIAVVIVLSLVALPLVSETAAYATNYYISPTGNDSNHGTLTDPFASITKAQSAAFSGDTVYLRGGIYKNFTIADSDSNYNYVHDITKSDITYKAYSASEIPVFDFSNVTTDKRVAAFRIAKGTKQCYFFYD